MKLISIYTALALLVCGDAAFAQHAVSLVSNNRSITHDHGNGTTTRRLAPTWELENAHGTPVSNSNFRGKPHIMIFYLGQDCLHCAEQLKAFNESAKSFKDRGVELVAISTDDSRSLHDAIEAANEPMAFTFLADPDLNGFKAFRAFDAFHEQALHGTFLVDAAGQIRWQDIGEHPFVDTVSLLAQVDQLKQDQDQDVERPKVFLDRSPRIVAYQLGRLDNEKLLLVERNTSEKKYAMVYGAILARDGMSPQFREEAMLALATLNESDPATELLQALDETKVETLQGKQTAEEIAGMLLKQPVDQLEKLADRFLETTETGNDIQRVVSYSALMMAGKAEQASNRANEDEAKTIDWLKSVALIPAAELRSESKPKILKYLSDGSEQVKVAAIQALKFVPADQRGTFQTMAEVIREDSLRPEAVRTMLSIPVENRDANISADLAGYFVEFAENTPAEKRTSNSFLDAMQLVDQLLVSLPVDQSKAYRNRLNQVTVRVVRIGTVEDEMRYDVPYFAVEAGRPVQVVLNNHDLMAHNLVFTKSGSMKQVAQLGGLAGPAKEYLPADRSEILFASDMIQTGQVAKLTFDAPSEVGEYPYVCTYPQHWSRMYGVMVVVKDLDAWLKNPIKPKDPIGNTRSFVQSWTVDALKDEIETGTQGRTLDIGKRIFAEATCAQCHQLGGEGGKVGPELDGVFTKHKHDRETVLREILEPSHRIDEEYVMHKILTLDGETITGIIQNETEEKYDLLDNPESSELTTVLKDDVDEMVRSSKSIMPKALLDNFSKDEIFELFSYLEQSQKK
jgi:putative heme-binding domain-containing protein